MSADLLAGSDDVLARPLAALAADVRVGVVSPTELVEASLMRIAETDAELGAFVTVDDEGVRTAARRAEARLHRGDDVGPFHGVPIAIKDLTATKGLRTTYGSRAFATHVPGHDAASVARIRRAGFLIVGKTSTSEFGALPVTDSEGYGSCCTPYDPDFNAGGSSGGSACAVAAGITPVAQGTDAGGSVRIPAAFCGVTGVKPSRGRVSLGPNATERLCGWATEGALAHTVEDAVALLDIMSGYELGDAYAPIVSGRPSPLRVAVTTDCPGDGVTDPQLAEAVRAAAAHLEGEGHVVTDEAPGWGGDEAQYVAAVWATLVAYYPVTDMDLLDRRTRALAELGAEMSALDYVRATVALQRLARRVAAFWDDHDVLLCPVTPMVAVRNDHGRDPLAERAAVGPGRVTAFTRWFNITGQPAAAVPFGRSDLGLPMSVQVVGPPGGDGVVRDISSELERVNRTTDASREQRKRTT